MQQMRDVARGADIVVGTPGRIMDLQSRGALDLSEVCLTWVIVTPARVLGVSCLAKQACCERC